MKTFIPLRGMDFLPVAFCMAILAIVSLPAQQPDEASTIRSIDAANQARYDRVLGFTDIQTYAVYRGKDEIHPVAAMKVKVTYKKGVGKNYQILSESGSAVIQKFGLHPLLDNEQKINIPGNVEHSWFTSANYEMKIEPGVPQKIDGRNCIALAIHPKHKAPNTIDGTLWVDAHRDSTCKIDGIASKSPSIFAGTTHMMRMYREISGFAMAAQARAESNGIWGRTVVIIDYSDYKIQLAAAK